jgi:hypothetical protein
MRLPNHPNPALHRRIFPLIVRSILVILSFSLIGLIGCSGGTPGSGFFSRLSSFETPTPTVAPAPTGTPTPEAEEIRAHPAKKPARQAHAVSRASSTAAAVVEGPGRRSEVSLEPNPGAPAPGGLATPSAPASAESAAQAARTPTLSSSALESSGAPDDASPAKAAKLIGEVDKTEKRVDRENLNADDSQRDILAQKLLTEAKQALAQRDSVAAMSLATKASTLLAPLPKRAD